YLSFWPMLANAAEGGKGEVMDAVLTGAALAVPGVIALLPWFQVERVVVYGGEFLERHREAGTDTELEAHLLFDVPAEDVVVVVHPQSVVHSMVEFHDGSTIAQASPPDMRLPIALGLTWPE
ncbi:hypothetical protein NL463_27590, partial [Klebsiella pneumoniae]|nr:hypothetical protein [Klebsiella pneumoniae]